MVFGHDGRLAQVFNNLIDNAVSFSPDGGTVRVAISTVDTSTSPITDEGPGIRGDISRIFQRFYTDRPEASISAIIPASASRFRVRSSRLTVVRSSAHNRTTAPIAVFTSGSAAARARHPPGPRVTGGSKWDGASTTTGLVLGSRGANARTVRRRQVAARHRL